MPTVYGLELPDYYFDWMDFLNIFEIDCSVPCFEPRSREG